MKDEARPKFTRHEESLTQPRQAFREDVGAPSA
jgi:hypothetical protein